MIIRAVLLLLLCASESLAQSSPGATYFSATELRDRVAGAAQVEERSMGVLLGQREGYRYIVLRRDQTGEMEMHERWDDIILVQEGSATVLYGGQLSGAEAAGSEVRGGGPGEWRGGEILGGSSQAVAAGDLMVIPAGIPHQVRVAPGGSVTYLVIKTARPTQAQDPKH